LFSESHFGVSLANPTDKTVSLPFNLFGGGVWGRAEQKIERKWFLSGGRRNAVEPLARISVVGAEDIV